MGFNNPPKEVFGEFNLPKGIYRVVDPTKPLGC